MVILGGFSAFVFIVLIVRTRQRRAELMREYSAAATARREYNQAADDLRQTAKILENLRWQYFGVGERVSRQRDRWKQLHQESAAKRAKALQMLEREIEKLRRQLVGAWRHINKLRAEMGKDKLEGLDGLIESTSDLASPPHGQCAEFIALMTDKTEAAWAEETDPQEAYAEIARELAKYEQRVVDEVVLSEEAGAAA